MRQVQAPLEHRLLTRLTTIKLAVQMLDRRAELSSADRSLLHRALEASDGLALDILQAEASLPGAMTSRRKASETRLIKQPGAADPDQVPAPHQPSRRSP